MNKLSTDGIKGEYVNIDGVGYIKVEPQSIFNSANSNTSRIVIGHPKQNSISELIFGTNIKIDHRWHKENF